MGFPGGSEVKASACDAGDLGLIPGSGQSPGEGHDNPLQYSCLENSTDRGAWLAIVYRVTKSQTRLSDHHFHFHMHARVLSHFSSVHLFDPLDCSLSGSSVHEILQARLLMWIAMPSSG